MKRILFLIFFIGPVVLFGQEKLRNWSLNGYVKDMVSVNDLGDSALVDNLIHQRFNFRWYPSDNIKIEVGMRNRVFFGDLVEAIPNYSTFIDTNNDYLNMSVTWVDRDKLVIHSVFDRAYLEWTTDKWEVRLGRQRINWGTNVVWNPNDIFNAYSFFDFDYEERPGSDAMRVTRYLGVASSIEMAAKLADDLDETVAAAMYKFNKGSYDVQILSGIALGDFVVGTGWAGNLGTASFKGEITYFMPYEERVGGEDALAFTTGIDYSFKNGLYLLGSYLYSSDGIRSLPPGSTFLLNTDRLSARNLMPFRNSIFLQASLPITPLINAGLGGMSFPGDNSFFLNPTLSVSLAQSLDLGVFGQLFFDDKPGGGYGSLVKSGFLRLKWSF